MPGPESRANRIILDPEGRKGPVPEPNTDVELLESTRRMWDRWWRSPQATMWHEPTAIDPLTRLALMYDKAARSEEGLSDRVQVEMRQLETQFGLNPKGLKELGWEVGTPRAEEAGPAGAVTEIERARQERRKRLEAG